MCVCVLWVGVHVCYDSTDGWDRQRGGRQGGVALLTLTKHLPRRDPSAGHLWSVLYTRTHTRHLSLTINTYSHCWRAESDQLLTPGGESNH